MEQDEHQDTLYDFLYKDSNRITSYYAQLFGGHLTAFEQTDSEKDSHPKSTSVNAGVIKHRESIIGEVSSGSKRVINPHDIIVTDVLSKLANSGALNDDIQNAPHGALVLVKGTLILTDRSMFGLATASFDAAIRDEQRKHKNQQNTAVIDGLTFLKEVTKNMEMPSSFLLKTDSGDEIAGIIKDEGMEEPISSYYFKHGSAGLSDVFAIGIKELTESKQVFATTEFLAGMQQAAQGMSEMLFSADAIRVTPVALFRRIEISPS